MKAGIWRLLRISAIPRHRFGDTPPLY